MIVLLFVAIWQSWLLSHFLVIISSFTHFICNDFFIKFHSNLLAQHTHTLYFKHQTSLLLYRNEKRNTGDCGLILVTNSLVNYFDTLHLCVCVCVCVSGLRLICYDCDEEQLILFVEYVEFVQSTILCYCSSLEAVQHNTLVCMSSS